MKIFLNLLFVVHIVMPVALWNMMWVLVLRTECWTIFYLGAIYIISITIYKSKNDDYDVSVCCEFAETRR